MVTCDLCDENFNKKFELSRHKFYIHDVDISTENAQPITCDLCDEIFDKTFQLSRHKFYVHNVDINNENVEEKDGKQEQLDTLCGIAFSGSTFSGSIFIPGMRRGTFFFDLFKIF